MALVWKNVKINVKNTNTSIQSKYIDLVDDCSGEAERGELYAIMGPSGSGKSTVLNALFGRIPPNAITSGIIEYDTEPRKYKEWIKKVAFLDQDDIFYDELTPVDAFQYAIRYRYNKKTMKKEADAKNISINKLIDNKIESLINNLELNDCSGNKMKNISGGERKRVMIGIEMLSDPDILFIDEPTSGLDSIIAYNFCKLLKELAVEKKIIIIMTIHQPSHKIFTLFDKLLLLSNGKTLYNDSISNIEEFICKSGIEKRSDITIPEILIEICEHEKSLQLEYDGGEKNNTINEKESIKKNELYFEFGINFYHIYLLIARYITINMKRKWMFLKSTGILLSNYCAGVFIFWHNIDTFKKSIIESAEIFNFLNGTNFGIDSVMKIELPKKLSESIEFLIFALAGGQIYFSSLSFVDISKILKKEISVAFYTASSVFVSYYIICSAINTIFSIIMCGLFYLILPSELYTRYIVIVLFLVGFFATPIGLLIASITFEKKTIMTLISISSFCLLYSPGLINIFAQLLRLILSAELVDKGVRVVRYFRFIFLFLPTLQFLFPLLYFYMSKMLDDLKNTSMYETASGIYQTRLIEYLSIIPNVQLKIYQSIIMLITITLLWITAGVFLLTWNLMPNIRLNLQKITKK